MADIFFSYTRGDRARVEPLTKALEAQGWTVWWDTDLHGGDSWNDVIEAELTKARCAIVAWSELSAKSDWVREEARVASKAHKLVPVLLESMDPPFGFGGVQAVDFSAWTGGSQAPEFLQLCTAVQVKLGASPPSPPPAQPPAEPKPASPSRWLWAAVAAPIVAVVVALGLWSYVPSSNIRIERLPTDQTPIPSQASPPPSPARPEPDAAAWGRSPPDQAYCFQRKDSPVAPGKFLVRCFLTEDLCQRFLAQDSGRKTPCSLSTGLRSAWNDAHTDERTPPTWHQYSNSEFSAPFPHF